MLNLAAVVLTSTKAKIQETVFTKRLQLETAVLLTSLSQYNNLKQCSKIEI